LKPGVSKYKSSSGAGTLDVLYHWYLYSFTLKYNSLLFTSLLRFWFNFA
jgi:hypothetical protein